MGQLIFIGNFAMAKFNLTFENYSQNKKLFMAFHLLYSLWGQPNDYEKENTRIYSAANSCRG